MSEFKIALRRIPFWAYLLVFLTILVNSVYLYYKIMEPADGLVYDQKNGQWTVVDYNPEGAGYSSGIRPGDIILSVDAKPFETWLDGYLGKKAGDKGIYRIKRDNREIQVKVTLKSSYSGVIGFFWALFFVTFLFSISSLYILVKRKQDKPAALFFIYIQIFIMLSGGGYIQFPEPVAMLANIAFISGGSLIGAVLIHFLLLFPGKSGILFNFKNFPAIFYGMGILCSVIVSVFYVMYIYQFSPDQYSIFLIVNKYHPLWAAFCYLVALFVAVSQFYSTKSTLEHNQLRLLIVGNLFILITPLLLVFFREWVIDNRFAFEIAGGVFSLILICCILIAIFRYRIWDIEIIIRKALLYFIATLIIISFYLLMLSIVERMTLSKNNTIRIFILAVSVIIFLMLRDRLQQLIARLFYRETYDSTSVVSDLEEKLAGIIKVEELKSKVVNGLDEIFHFRSFSLNLKKDGLSYELAFALGKDHQGKNTTFEINTEFENKLVKSKVFSPNELVHMPEITENSRGELIVPMLKADKPFGFFCCGPKLSERTYSLQDIRVLSLVAKRVIALFEMAELYQRDLDRQLMLERERARISQDMHDEIGASLTRISMMSDLVKNGNDVGVGARQWLGQISDTSHGLMEEMNQIIWALNPKNDNLEGLVAYFRRFAFEFLEPTPVSCIFDLPAELPDKALSVEVRRNVYLVVREALHNVVKHAGATKVHINLQLDHLGFRIKIQDDGQGFDPGKLDFPGNGLINMKKRMLDIGGEMIITSEKGKGTEIELALN